MTLYEAFIIGVGFSIGASVVNGTKLLFIVGAALLSGKKVG